MKMKLIRNINVIFISFVSFFKLTRYARVCIIYKQLCAEIRAKYRCLLQLF